MLLPLKNFKSRIEECLELIELAQAYLRVKFSVYFKYISYYNGGYMSLYIFPNL